MKQSNQELVKVEQNRQRDIEWNKQIILDLKKQVEKIKSNNEVLQNIISAEIGSLKDELRESTVQEVKNALQANIEAIQRAIEGIEKQSNTFVEIMEQKVQDLENSKNKFFKYEGKKIYLFWAGIVCNIGTFILLLLSIK